MLIRKSLNKVIVEFIFLTEHFFQSVVGGLRNILPFGAAVFVRLWKHSDKYLKSLLSIDLSIRTDS